MPTKLKQIPKIAIFSHFFQFANYSMGNTETFSKYSTQGLLSSEKKTDIFVFLLSPVNSFKKIQKNVWKYFGHFHQLFGSLKLV